MNPVSAYYCDYKNPVTAIVEYRTSTELLVKLKEHIKAFPGKDMTFIATEVETLSDFNLDINLTIPSSQTIIVILNLTLKGASTISLGGSNYSVQSLSITEGNASKSFANHIVQVKGENISLVNFSMTNYHVKNTDLDYIRVYSSGFQLHNSLIQDKSNNGVFLRLDFPERHIIKQCVFKYFRKTSATNGGEMIRCATSQFEKKASHMLLESCYFEDCDGDPEAVSVKCSAVTIRKCIFISNAGRLVLRHAHDCVVESNYFSSNGIRAYGTNHNFIGNQFDQGAGLLLDNKKGNSYVPARDCLIDGLYYTSSVNQPLTNKGTNCVVKNMKRGLVITEESLFTKDSEQTAISTSTTSTTDPCPCLRG
jgi:hypothetical protein